MRILVKNGQEGSEAVSVLVNNCTREALWPEERLTRG
jgi:hypothetical protein